MKRCFTLGKSLLVLALICSFISMGLFATTTSAEPIIQRQIIQRQISYLRGGDLYLLDLTSKQTTQLTKRGDISSFAWSSDGNQIAFEADSGTSSDIYLMQADGNHLSAVANTPLDESLPTFTSVRAGLWYVERLITDSNIRNVIVERDLPGLPTGLYEEQGGLCHITGFQMHSATNFVLSRDCGRRKNVSVIDTITHHDTPIGSDKCLRRAVWSDDVGTIAAIQTDCSLDSSTPQIATFSPFGPRQSQQDTPDRGLGFVDWVPGDSGYFTSLVYGSDNGLWLISNDGNVVQISSIGGLPRWRPEPTQPLPLPVTDYEPGMGMPRAGDPQANDWVAWGGLVACVAIAAGLVLISLRRRKGGDGL